MITRYSPSCIKTGIATNGADNISIIIVLSIGQYQFSMRSENDNHNDKINMNESVIIRMLRLNELGKVITSDKR